MQAYTGATNQIHIYPEQVENLSVPDIPLSEQQRIVDTLMRQKGDELAQMTPEEKYERTSYASFLSRHNVINVSYTDNLEPIWYLTQNEYPYIIFNGKKVKDHKTLWISPNVRDNDIDKRAKQTSLPEKGYIRFENAHNQKSVPGRPHIHFLLF